MAEAEDLKSSQCGFDPHSGHQLVAYLVIFVCKLSIEIKAIAIIAFSIHTQFIHIARGFSGDELTCSAFTANSSALEQSPRSCCLCHWAIGSKQTPHC